MRLRKKFAMFLLAVTAACFMAASAVFAFAAGSGVRVEDFFTADGLTLTENVAGTSLKDGGGTALFPDEDKMGIQVGGEGGTLTVNKSLFGAFEMDFRVWAETTMTSGEWGNFADTAAYNTREVAITLDDGNNKFTIHVRGGDDRFKDLFTLFVREQHEFGRPAAYINAVRPFIQHLADKFFQLVVIDAFVRTEGRDDGYKKFSFFHKHPSLLILSSFSIRPSYCKFNSKDKRLFAANATFCQSFSPCCGIRWACIRLYF